IAWAGVASGAVDSARNRLMMFGGGGAAGLCLLVMVALSATGAGGAVALALPMIGFIVGARFAYEGRRLMAAEEKVLWALTNRRLLRVTASSAAALGKADIASISRGAWGPEKRPSLEVTAKASAARKMGRRITIVGPGDLDAAERAIRSLVD
ncbi:MAG: hypothetical protein K2Q06_02095, partial [Parvularculaceae bacterium]|nr:hypothetical protein [Parvularculaceae bacterium]